MIKLVHTGLSLACRFHGQNQPLFLQVLYSFFVTWSGLQTLFLAKFWTSLHKGTFWMQYFFSFKIKHIAVKWLFLKSDSSMAFANNFRSILKMSIINSLTLHVAAVVTLKFSLKSKSFPYKFYKIYFIKITIINIFWYLIGDIQ